MDWSIFEKKVEFALKEEDWDKILSVLKSETLSKLKTNSEEDEKEKSRYNQFAEGIKQISELLGVSDFALDDFLGEQNQPKTDITDETKDAPETVQVEEKPNEKSEKEIEQPISAPEQTTEPAPESKPVPMHGDTFFID